ncbi:hypothetical protein C9426_35090 [Serratia sp. S1B]|nr:hypothetical protein C9426_35090 [Serratia sp. S1B]
MFSNSLKKYIRMIIPNVLLSLFATFATAKDVARVLPVLPENVAWQNAILESKKTLGAFKKKLNTINISDDTVPMVKVPLQGRNRIANVWLLVIDTNASGFEGVIFEPLSELPDLNVGDKLSIDDERVIDWSLNINGTMYGAYTMRYQRNKLSDAEKIEFDQYVGVKQWAELKP